METPKKALYTELSHTSGKEYSGPCHNGTFVYFKIMNIQNRAITELSYISENVAF